MVGNRVSKVFCSNVNAFSRGAASKSKGKRAGGEAEGEADGVNFGGEGLGEIDGRRGWVGVGVGVRVSRGCGF